MNLGQHFGTCMNIPAMIQFAMSGGIIGAFEKIKQDYIRIFYKYSVQCEIIGKGEQFLQDQSRVSLDNNSAGSIRD